MLMGVRRMANRHTHFFVVKMHLFFVIIHVVCFKHTKALVLEYTHCMYMCIFFSIKYTYFFDFLILTTPHQLKCHIISISQMICSRSGSPCDWVFIVRVYPCDTYRKVSSDVHFLFILSIVYDYVYTIVPTQMKHLSKSCLREGT